MNNKTNNRRRNARLESEIRTLRAHLSCLQDHLDEARRRHKKMNYGNGTYDDVSYHSMQLFLHSSFIRELLDNTSFEGADGKGKRFLELDDGSRMSCYRE